MSCRAERRLLRPVMGRGTPGSGCSLLECPDSADALGFPGPFAGLELGVAELFRRHQMRCMPDEFCRRQVLESQVTPALVLLNAPSFDLRLGFVNRLEPVNVQAFVPERSVERPDEPVVGRLASLFPQSFAAPFATFT